MSPCPSTDLCLDHVDSLGPHELHAAVDVHLLLGLGHVQQVVKGYKGARSTHASTVSK